jgi:hypothetical protein
VGESADAVPTAVRDLVIAAALVGLAFGIVGAAVFALGDQDTFVSPPEVVAEEFVRALGHGRIEPARSMLASDAERATSTREVRRVATRLRSRIGHLDNVDARVDDRTRDSAIVSARVEGARANAELMLPLVFEHGTWSVARISEASAPAVAPR